MNYKIQKTMGAFFTATTALIGSSCSTINEQTKMKDDKIHDTELAYLRDTYLWEDKATLLEINKDEKGVFGIFDRTVFYPQGGGQPSDLGFIQIEEIKCRVQHVAFSEGKVLHYLDKIDEIKTGATVIMSVDSERRIFNAKAHTAGHLLDAVSRQIAPNIIGKKGYHFPEGPYVEFEGALNLDPNAFAKEVNALLANAIKAELPVKVINADSGLLEKLHLPVGFKVPEGKECRFVQIEGFQPVPCGGTHISNLSQLKEVTVKKVNSKKGNTKVSYNFF